MLHVVHACSVSLVVLSAKGQGLEPVSEACNVLVFIKVHQTEI
jgi:hypothetical protein